MRHPEFFEYKEDFNKVSIAYHDTVENLLTVTIPEPALEKMMDFEYNVFKQMADSGTLDLFNMLVEQKEHEKYLRETYPGVKKEYEHYSLMLALANGGKGT
jgi:hypothetical protein